MASLNSLKSNGVNNDSGLITTNSSGGVSLASVTASGNLQTTGGSLLLQSGTIKRLKQLNATIGAGGNVVITHNFGEVPSIYLATYTQAGGAAALVFTNGTTTQVTLNGTANIACSVLLGVGS